MIASAVDVDFQKESRVSNKIDIETCTPADNIKDLALVHSVKGRTGSAVK